MASLKVSSMFCLNCSSQIHSWRRSSATRATLSSPQQATPLSLPSISLKPDSFTTLNSSINTSFVKHSTQNNNFSNDQTVIKTKMHAIMEAVGDRFEMHKNIGAQRDNWNSLLLTSINTITLTASTMAALASTSALSGAAMAPLKLSSTLLYLAATGILVVMNKIQPSQLAEEQRNAARLFKQLHGKIKTTLSLGNPSVQDVNQAMEKVLALDKAYPLPLLGTMLEKFPKKIEPARWWPLERHIRVGRRREGNGWSEKLEEEMREIVGIIKRNDLADYLRLSEKALKLNSLLAISGPVLTTIGALGSALVGNSSYIGNWGVMVGVVAGVLASIVNTIEHGGQVGMVFEMYRANAGLFKLVEETIESNLKEIDVERRENGEVLEMKVSLQLGRSLSELKNLAASSRNGVELEEFASKLF
ncbi:hypothetical protein UlMin_011225 [Ulmus minor]